MAIFRVTNIIDDSSIQVTPRWVWQGKTGNVVKITESSTTNLQAKILVKLKLNNFLLDKEIELKNPTSVLLKCLILHLYVLYF